MISSQRLILIIVMINLMIGFVGEIYQNPTAYSSDTATTQIALYEEYENEYQSEEGLWGTIKATTLKVYENTIGNVVSWGKILFNIFGKGLNPFSIRSSQFNNNVEKQFANIILLFRSLMMTLVILEAYFIFKNKKQS